MFQAKHPVSKQLLFVWRTDKQSDTHLRRKMTRNDDEARLCVLSEGVERGNSIQMEERKPALVYVCVIVRLAFRTWCCTG